MLFRAFKKVFNKPFYIIMAIITMVVVYLISVWLPNIPLILKIMRHSDLSIIQKVNIPISLLGSIHTNFTLFSAIYTILIAIFFGINLSMIIYFFKRKIKTIKKSGVTTSFLGLLSGLLGVGCAACGSLILTSLLALFGASWVLEALPFRGEEFGAIGVILLVISIYTVAKQIENPTVCSI